MLTVEKFLQSILDFTKVNLNVFYACCGDSRIIHMHLDCEYPYCEYPEIEKLVRCVQLILKRLFPDMVIQDETYYAQMVPPADDPYGELYSQPYALYCLACETLTAVSEDTEEVICRTCSPDGEQIEFW